ncbi:MAG: DUF1934 domain-containing protein [Ruminococcaceae bacterium]|nr:DUF1934 domain-containing protein [Oscillospiraceae bacterium]
MKMPVMLSLRGQQDYGDQEPEIISLITEGTLEKTEAGWIVSYKESDLTGLDGVTTTFSVEKDMVTLVRTGKLESRMVFQRGVPHESLYQMEFGALMISVCATAISWDITEFGGVIDLCYDIAIEQTAMGVVTYHLDIALSE